MSVVKYIGASDDQVSFAGQDPRPKLKEGAMYVVAEEQVQPWYTLLRLEGGNMWFNSVCFEEQQSYDSSERVGEGPKSGTRTEQRARIT